MFMYSSMRNQNCDEMDIKMLSFDDFLRSAVSTLCSILMVISIPLISLSNSANNLFIFHQKCFANWQKTKNAFLVENSNFPTILCLPSHPLAATSSPPSTILQSSLTIRRNLFGSNTFEYNSFTHALNFSQPFRNVPHPCSSRRAVDMIHDQHLL